LAAPFPYFEDGTITCDPSGAVWRHISHGKPCRPRRIDNPDQSKGYRNVRLPIDGKWVTVKAHRVVWQWHHGPIPAGMQIDHINTVRDDNRITNLQLLTQGDNLRKAWRVDGANRPRSVAYSKSHDTRLVDQMRTARKSGATLREIADESGVSISHAHRLTGGMERNRV